MASKSEIKTCSVFIKNRRPLRPRIEEMSRVRPLAIDYGKLKQRAKLVNSAGYLLKQVDLPLELARLARPIS